MPCFNPLEAWRGRKCGPSGKVRIVFAKEDSCGVRVELPCGQCIGCKLERSRQWAVRCMHEASLHVENCFLTLTYDPAYLPDYGSLDVTHWQKFAKRMRKRVGKFRFFHCGEYGDRLERPHLHACIFGFDFPDKRYFKTTSAGEKIYTSDLLDDLWSFGHCAIGDVTFESAAYVARYVTKKVTGDGADEHYTRMDDYGQVVRLAPEYVTMSRRPGIAADWFRQYSNEVYPSDEIIARGFPAKPPRYYDSLLEVASPEFFAEVKKKRVLSAKKHSDNCTPERLRVRERVARAKLSLFKRPLSDW